VTEQELRQLVAGGESASLELKLRTSQGLVNESARAIAAFSTSGSGRIVFGARDDGAILGQTVTDQTIRDLANQYRADIQPTVNPLIERVPVTPTLEAIVVTVDRGQVGPYRYRGVPYERAGSTNQQIREERYQQLLLERLHGVRRWENELLEGWTIADLDEAEIIRTLEAGIENGRIPDPGTRDPGAILESFHLIREGELVRAAAILFGKQDKLAATFQQCVLKQAQIAGDDPSGSTFLDQRPPLHGNIFQLYEAGQRFVIEHSPNRREIKQGAVTTREDTPTYPPDAVQEALANAFCHRDYSAGGGAVTLRMFDDHLEIFSAGQLPFGMTPADLFRHHDSHPWNPLIADVLYYRRIIDAFGTGIGRMSRAMTDAGLPTPTIEEVGGSVLVTLTTVEAPTLGRQDAYRARLAERRTLILELAEEGQFTSAEAAARLNVGERTARRSLEEMVVAGELQRKGRGPKTTYQRPE
jgi:ATP-dependent DNA helicase RecG